MDTRILSSKWLNLHMKSYFKDICIALDINILAICIYRELNRQLNFGRVDFVKWVLDARFLFCHFIQHNNFTQARYHIAAATHILQKHQDVLETKGPSKNRDEEYKVYHRNSADVAKCWAKYGITLMKASMERLLEKVGEEGQCSSNELKNFAGTNSTEPILMENLRYVDIEPELETITNQVTDHLLYLLKFKDAKLMFLNVKKWLEKEKGYYTLDNYASEHVNIVRSFSHAYLYLSIYVKCECKLMEMHKQRINMLENLIAKLDSQYYRDVCQRIWLDLGTAYSIILDIEVERLRASDEEPTAYMRMKIDNLAKEGIKYLRSLLDSLETDKSDDGILNYSNEQLDLLLCAHFLLGKLYNTVFISNLQLEMKYTEQSLRAFTFIISYCEEHPEKVDELQMHEIITISRKYVDQLKVKHKLKQVVNNINILSIKIIALRM